jgi:hypothetical protein
MRSLIPALRNASSMVFFSEGRMRPNTSVCWLLGYQYSWTMLLVEILFLVISKFRGISISRITLCDGSKSLHRNTKWCVRIRHLTPFSVPASSPCLLQRTYDISTHQESTSRGKRHPTTLREQKFDQKHVSRLDQSTFQRKASLSCTINGDPHRVFEVSLLRHFASIACVNAQAHSSASHGS